MVMIVVKVLFNNNNNKTNCLINLKLQQDNCFIKFIFWILTLLIKIQQRLLYKFFLIEVYHIIELI